MRRAGLILGGPCFDWPSKATVMMLAVMTAVMLAMAVLAPYYYAAATVEY